MNSTLEGLKSDIASANNELSKYTEALFELEQERRSGASVDDESEGRRLVLSQREREMSQELEKLREEEESLNDELQRLIEEDRSLDFEEAKLRDGIVSLARTILDSDESMDAVNRKLQYCQFSLRRLKRMSLLDEAFHISAHGPGFGTVNGVRIGQPSVPWAEVNAGLGFLCLLMDVLVKRTNMSLTQYRLLPRGSYSVIIKRSDKSVLELFADDSSGGISRFLTGRKFDSAMTAFALVVSELVTLLQRENRAFSVPHAIDEQDGKVGDLPITLQFNSEENWSNAVKMLMIDIQSLSTYIDAKFPY